MSRQSNATRRVTSSDLTGLCRLIKDDAAPEPEPASDGEDCCG